MSNPDQERYVTSLTYYLRERNVPGERIGEILAEVEAHTAASGKPPHEEFGEARDYAKQWADPTRSLPERVRNWLVQLPALVLAGFGCFLLAQGGMSLSGGNLASFGLPGGWAALVGAALFGVGAVIVTSPDDRIVDPRTGRALSKGRRSRLLFFLYLGAVAFAMGLILGALP